jgi:hypothetical protein
MDAYEGCSGQRNRGHCGHRGTHPINVNILAARPYELNEIFAATLFGSSVFSLCE